MSERSRSAIYQGLSVIVEDPQAVQEMLSHFPARDVEEMATKEFVRAELAELRAEFHDELRRLQTSLIATMVAIMTVHTSLTIGAFALLA